MNPSPNSSPAHERGAADHDQAYAWGRPPDTYLAPREIARMMIFRSRLEERHLLRNRRVVDADDAAPAAQSSQAPRP
jgi:hypothetical protein